MLTKVADLRERNVTEIKLERQNWGKCLDMMSGHADRFRHSNEVYKALKNKTKQKKPSLLFKMVYTEVLSLAIRSLLTNTSTLYGSCLE